MWHCAALCNRYGGFDTQYSAWQPGFIDFDRRAPAQEQPRPEPSAAQFLGTRDGWRAMPRARRHREIQAKICARSMARFAKRLGGRDEPKRKKTH